MKQQFTLIFCASNLWLFSSHSCQKLANFTLYFALLRLVLNPYEWQEEELKQVHQLLAFVLLPWATWAADTCMHTHDHTHTPSTVAWSWNEKADMMLWKNNGLKTNVSHVLFSSWHNNLWDVLPKDQMSSLSSLPAHFIFFTLRLSNYRSLWRNLELFTVNI